MYGRAGGNTTKTDNTHAKQPPTEKAGSKERGEVDGKRRKLKCPSLLKVTRNDVNASASTLRASDHLLVVAFEFKGRPDLERGPAQCDDVQDEGRPNVGDRLRHESRHRHQEKPAVEQCCGNVLSSEEQ